MCESDCNLCITATNTCVCESGYGGFGEGVNLNGCQLNQHAIDVLWYIALASCALELSVSAGVLARWIWGGEIDWARLVANRNFKIVVGSNIMCFFFGVLAVLRVLDVSYAFNDVAATIFFVLGHMMPFLQSVPLTDLNHETSVALLTALGRQDKIHPCDTWFRPAFVVIALVPYLPVLAAPALDWAQRKIMVQYFLIVSSLIGVPVICTLTIIAQKAIKVLVSIGTDATIVPRQRLRRLQLNFLISGVCGVTGHAVMARYSQYYPYLLPVLIVSLAFGALPTVFGLSYDRSKITKPNSNPSKTKGTDRSRAEPSTTPPGTGQQDNHWEKLSPQSCEPDEPPRPAAAEKSVGATNASNNQPALAEVSVCTTKEDAHSSNNRQALAEVSERAKVTAGDGNPFSSAIEMTSEPTKDPDALQSPV